MASVVQMHYTIPMAEKHPQKLEIRKYPNRRYYDTTRSRHLTLDEIHNAIRQGDEVRVIDSKSKRDITSEVLVQIIAELDPPKLGVFSVPLLHRLLRSNEKMLGDFVERFFSQPLGALLDSQRSMEQVFREAMGLNIPVPMVSDWTKLMMGRLAPQESRETELRELVRQLREELAELRASKSSRSRKTKKSEG